MQRRDVLQRGSAAAVTVLTAGLAGCSGESGGTDDSGEDGTDGGNEPTPTPTPSGPSGEIVENGVSGLRIVDWTTERTDEDLLVTLTVENVGDQKTDAFDYTYEATAYDSAGQDITAGVATGSTGSTIDPGQTTTINMYIGALGGPGEIARFELRLRCDDFFDDGVYCAE